MWRKGRWSVTSSLYSLKEMGHTRMAWRVGFVTLNATSTEMVSCIDVMGGIRTSSTWTMLGLRVRMASVAAS